MQLTRFFGLPGSLMCDQASRSPSKRTSTAVAVTPAQQVSVSHLSVSRHSWCVVAPSGHLGTALSDDSAPLNLGLKSNEL